LFQRLDKTAVYLLIAGTYTPIVSILLTGAWRRWVLRGIWLIAVGGVACIWLLPEDPQRANAAHAAVVGMYLGLGWIGILPLPLYYRAVGWRAMNYVWVGAGLYSVGAICELTQWPVIVEDWEGLRFGYHEVLHVTHAAASVAFFLFVVRYVIPYRPEPPIQTRRRPTSEAHTGFSLPSPLAER
jgi:hemolysin III